MFVIINSRYDEFEENIWMVVLWFITADLWSILCQNASLLSLAVGSVLFRFSSDSKKPGWETCCDIAGIDTSACDRQI